MEIAERLRRDMIPALLVIGAVLGTSPALAAQDNPPSSGSAAQASSDTGPVAHKDLTLRTASIFFPDLATDRTTLSPEEKLRLAIKKSIAPASFLAAAAGSAINQATNSPSGYGQGAEGYGKRFGASMATRATSNLFGGFVIASLAREDPRYFVHGKGTFGQRLGHAVSRVVVAPKDRGGYGFNWGGVFGPLGAETFASTYQPVAEQTGGRTMRRYGIDLATAAGGNLLREFWPDIFKRLGLMK